MPETPREATAAGGSGTAPGTLGVGAPVVLACYDVTKSYGGVLAVDSVSLEVPRRGLFGLCGFNGAGKSTLFNLLAGSVRADSGSVRIDGQGRDRMVRHAQGPLRSGQDVADGSPRPRTDGGR